MLGRNAARPLGLTPARLTNYTTNKIAYWITKPFSVGHMQRFITISPQLLLTIGGTSSLNHSKNPSSSASSSSSTTVSSTTATANLTAATTNSSSSCSSSSSSTPTATCHQIYTPVPLQADIVLQSLLLTPPPSPSPSSLSASATAAAGTPQSSTPTTATGLAPAASSSAAATATAPNSAIAYNYMLAASWSPKSRQRRAMMPSVSNLSLTSATQTVAAHIPVKDSEEELRRRQSMHGKSSTPPTRATATATATSMPVRPTTAKATPLLSSTATTTTTTTTQTPTPSTKRQRQAGKVDAGEDAFFHVSTPSRVALGVADGVGGWSEFGVDPAQFSWALMENAEKMAHLTDNIADMHDDPASRDRVLDAQTILDGAYHRLVESGKVEAGSSTACILSLCKITGTLRASNLGDSSFLLIRDKRCIYESPSQQHFWNCPYQLTIVPPGFRASKAPAKKNKSYVQDLPKDAVQSTHQLEDGDVIVLATDGFWDNVFTKDTLELVEKELGDVIRDKRHQLAHHRRRHHPSSASTSISTTSSMMAPYNHHPLPLQHLSQQLQSEELVTVQQKADGAISLSIEQDKDDDMNSPPLTAQEVVERVRALSRRLTNTARHISLDQTRITPFSEGSSHLHSGGKVDDITVIVTLVRSI